jgi:hypothetical protein
MTIGIVLSPELENRLRQEAQRAGVAEEQVVVRILDQHLPPSEKRGKAIALLQSWIDEDNAAEQKETGDFLIKALDEDRLSDRKLFPPELKDVTW